MNRKTYSKYSLFTFVFVGVFCFMAIGYALLSQRISINGTANFIGEWNIQITSITSKVTGAAVNKAEPTGIGLTTATFNVDMYKPGDKIEYTITLENRGNIDAIVNDVILSGNDSNDVNYVTEGIEKGNVLKVSESLKFKVIVEYKSTATTLLTGSKSLLVNIDIVQKEGSNITPVEKTEYAADTLTSNITSTGDGLYADSTETGRYIYRGQSPSNYIIFNNETWRILSIESDGTLKIVKNEKIGTMKWDEENKRPSSTNTFCTLGSLYGCSAWAATSNLVGSPSEYKQYYPNGNTSDSDIHSGSVIADATLNTYLNGDYYNNLGTDKKYVVSHDFNVSTPGDQHDTESIAVNVSQEKQYTWNGKVGLINITEYLKTSTNSECVSLNYAYNNTGCGDNNWLYLNSGTMWTISPSVINNDSYVWSVYDDGDIYDYCANGPYDVHPVVYLTSNINLEGNGIIGDEYKIVES